MERIAIQPREKWQTIVESQGFHFHTAEGDDGEPRPCWDESAYYAFTSAQVDLLEKASYTLNDLTLKAVEHVIAHDLFDRFQIPPPFRPFVRTSWERDEHTVYGRFDFSYDGQSPPQLLEYNADTPTALLEAAVVQWHWLKDRFPDLDQFNSIHERLIEAWSGLKEARPDRWYFTSLRDHIEDFITVNYLRDTAIQAGLETEYIAIEDIGWNGRQRMFVDGADRPIRHAFKLYPWEWLIRERFGPDLLGRYTDWMEPAWKMLLSNKAILTVLWELFPDCPYLLRTQWEPFGDNYVRKPIFGREGENVTLVQGGQCVEQTEGFYAKSPVVYQELHPLPCLGGHYPVVGSWMVNGYACGVGVREDDSPVTRNTSRFVPHLIR